ncbi:MAG TPA: NDP-sugar synthase [Candidatus Binatia bacterium]|nr:NDP-sugar synthase [Candidatus Binatia bacterium]
MKAMILAGGMSTRLYPLTHQVPKPLVPLAGEPITAHILRYLRSFGIVDVAINVHYLADAIRAYFGDGSAYGVRLHYVHEEELSGSAGGLKKAEPFFDETFVVVGCDDLTDANLDALIAFHRKREAIATIGLVQMEQVDQYGVVILDDRGRIVQFQEKPEPGTELSHLVNTGIYCFEPEIFTHIPSNEFVDFGRDVFPSLQARNEAFYGLPLPGAYWCDIGTPSEYLRATRDALSGVVHLRGARPRGIAADAFLGDDVRIEGDVRIGSGVRLGKRARIVGPSVIGDGSVVGDGVTIEGSVLWDECRVGEGAQVRDAIVGVGYDVPARSCVIGQIVANGSTAKLV